MTDNRTERTEQPLLTATRIGKGLGDLSLGSIQSRAAARLLAQQRRDTEKRMDVVVLGIAPPDSMPKASEWTRERDGTLMRVIWIPEGSVLVDGLRAVGGFSESELANVVEHCHAKTDCFELLTIAR